MSEVKKISKCKARKARRTRKNVASDLKRLESKASEFKSETVETGPRIKYGHIQPSGYEGLHEPKCIALTFPKLVICDQKSSPVEFQKSKAVTMGSWPIQPHKNGLYRLQLQSIRAPASWRSIGGSDTDVFGIHLSIQMEPRHFTWTDIFIDPKKVSGGFRVRYGSQGQTTSMDVESDLKDICVRATLCDVSKYAGHTMWGRMVPFAKEDDEKAVEDEDWKMYWLPMFPN